MILILIQIFNSGPDFDSYPAFDSDFDSVSYSDHNSRLDFNLNPDPDSDPDLDTVLILILPPILILILKC